MAKKALGKGLGALIKPTTEQNTALPDGERVHYLSIGEIIPSPHNPRKEFTSLEISELGASIREHGIIQPLIVRKTGDFYELIAGERRWRASQSIQLKTVPAIVREASDRDVIEMALIENLQRQDLNPIEEATGYLRLSREFQLTQEQIAKQVGKSRASVANAMRLLDLQDPLQTLLAKGELSVGHAKVLLAVKNDEHQSNLADQVIRNRLTVRQTEKAVQELNAPPHSQAEQASTQHKNSNKSELAVVQNILRDHFATPVNVSDNGKKGKIEFEFRGVEDLQRILDLLGVGTAER